MLVSFASQHLWLHWRPTGLHLARQWLDNEPGIHWSQMQMQSAVVGINRVRIYSPTRQAKQQDPAGEFIRRWVPELHERPRRLHSRALGVERGKSPEVCAAHRGRGPGGAGGQGQNHDGPQPGALRNGVAAGLRPARQPQESGHARRAGGAGVAAQSGEGNGQLRRNAVWSAPINRLCSAALRPPTGPSKSLACPTPGSGRWRPSSPRRTSTPSRTFWCASGPSSLSTRPRRTCSMP